MEVFKQFLTQKDPQVMAKDYNLLQLQKFQVEIQNQLKMHLRGNKEMFGKLDELNEIKEQADYLNETQEKHSKKLHQLTQKVDSHVKELKQVKEQLYKQEKLQTLLKQAKEFTRLFILLKNQPDNLKLSILIHDIESTLQDTDLNQLSFLKKELDEYSSIKQTLTTDALKSLQVGLDSNNLQELTKGVQVFVNLQTLPVLIKDLILEYQQECKAKAQKTFDMNSLNEEMKELKRSGQIPANTSSLVAWAGILWSRVEKLGDVIYEMTFKMHTLESFLSRRNDSSNQTVLLEYVVKELSNYFKGDYKTIKNFFWKGLGDILDTEITTATKSSQFLLQVLQAGYPKLLRIFLDLYSRIKLVSGDEIQLLSMTNFESAYVTRSFTRLNEAVSNVLQKGTPNRDDAAKLSRTVSSELNATKFDPELLSKISHNVSKSLSSFTTKVESFVLYDNKITISGGSLPQAQVIKVDVINCIYSLSESIWGLVIDYDGSTIQDSLVTLSVDLVDLMKKIATPLFTTVISELELVMAKMHKEEDKPNRDQTQVSSYLTEYVAKIRWVFRELISKMYLEAVAVEWARNFSERVMTLHCLHTSLVKVTNEARLRITADLSQVEYVLGQSLALVHGNFEDLKTKLLFKNFKKLMYMELGDITVSIPVDSIYACNHVLSRSVIQKPMGLCGWSESEYVNWIDSSDPAAQKSMIVKCCDVYLQGLEASGAKESCLEHPTLRKLLLDWDTL